MDLKQHLVRQMVFSKATWGPGARTNGVLDHMLKEIDEVRTAENKAAEWVDLVILALDGLTREIWADTDYECPAPEIAADAIRMIEVKQARNELRNWPDWRGADPDKAIEHVRGHHD